MSKISLTPNAAGTGTFTIASPNSNTNRTLTLPDADGALLTADDLPSGGATLLGTIATTSGTSVTLSGLDLTGYTHLQLIAEGVSSNQTTAVYARLNNQNLLTVAINGVTDYSTGSGFIHIPTGVFWSASSVFWSGDTAGRSYGYGGASGLTSASTSITITLTAGVFDAGSIKVYGVA